MDFEFDNIPEKALAWHRSGAGAVLATVIDTWGSAPRPAGSQLAISGKGEFAGSVSGGCVEGAVVVEALEALKAQESRILEYGVADEGAFAVGLACGGTIRVLVEPIGDQISETLLERLTHARQSRIQVAYAVNTRNWTRHLIQPGDNQFTALHEQFARNKSGFLAETFVAIHNPPLRLAVVGAAHIAQPLLQMAKLTGYDTVLIDPREAFASSARFPEQNIDLDWPDEALKNFGLDARTAVVTLSHDPKIDDPAVVTALGSDVFYVGCLGSRRTHAKRVERLEGQNLSKQEMARIHAPVGLDIGAISPAEIALAVMAEITQVLRRGAAPSKERAALA